MIKLNEIRIGNWIEANGEKVLIQDIHMFEGRYHVFHLPNILSSGAGAGVTLLSECKPILLTLEILEKTGYQLNHTTKTTSIYSSIPWEESFYLGPNDDIGIRYRKGHPYEFTHGDYNIAITHLHQLQNLYADLTNKELLIYNL